MTNSSNPLREVTSSPFSVPMTSNGLVIDGVYGVEDIVKPLATESVDANDPRYMGPNSGSNLSIDFFTPPAEGWISPAELGGDGAETVVQFNFDSIRYINSLSFEISSLPCNWSLWYLDLARGKMVPLTASDGQLLKGVVTGSKITVRTGETIIPNNWSFFSYDLPKISTILVELHLNRELSSFQRPQFFNSPQNAPYPLSIRKVRFRYEVETRTDAPALDEDVFINHSLGFYERIRPYDYSADKAYDTDTTTYWLSSPQPLASAVVPFYLDIRDSGGNTRLFDRMRLLPIAPGPRMNLYYSIDDNIAAFQISRHRANFDVAGSSATTNAAFSSAGVAVTGSNAAWTLSNDHVRLDFNKDWAVGGIYKPTDTNTAGNRWLWAIVDGGSNSLGIRFAPSSNSAGSMTGTFQIVQGSNTTMFTSSSVTLSVNVQYAVLMGYVHSSEDANYPQGWYLTVAAVFDSSGVQTPPGTLTIQSGAGTIPTDFFPTIINLGNSSATGAVPARGAINRFFIKQDSFYTPAMQAFANTPDNFILGRGQNVDRVSGRFNALLLAKLTISLTCLAGPGSEYFNAKSWVPLQRDFVLRNGMYSLPPINAKYIKLEFTRLVPQPYPVKDGSVLTMLDFPDWVKNWYSSMVPKAGSQLQSPGGTLLFESYRPAAAPDPSKKIPAMQYILGPTRQKIFNPTMGTVETYLQEGQLDDATLAAYLSKTSQHMKFFRAGTHDYATHDVPMRFEEAYFVGLREIKLFRADYSAIKDTPEYVETFIDDQHIATVVGFARTNGIMTSAAAGNTITSKTFLSISKFKSIQFAAMGNDWETIMTNNKMGLVTFDHLNDPAATVFTFNSGPNTYTTTTTLMTPVTNQYLGARGGNQLRVERVSGGTAAYGVRTIGFTSGTITGSQPRTSTMARILLPDTAQGTYELRLYAVNGGTFLRASRPFKPVVGQWLEVDLAFIATAGDSSFQAAIVQTDPTVNEAFVVDFLGIFQHPLKWEMSNDAGSNWRLLLRGINDPKGYMSFTSTNNQLKIRVTALKIGAVVAGFTIVPWYIESPVVSRMPIDYLSPWGQSESNELRATDHKPMFQMWNRLYPQQYSIGRPVSTLI